MLDRCRNPKMKFYRYYGGRGIKVCERWQEFESFVTDMGEPPTPLHTLDRVDTNGHYEPGNCRWATNDVQQNNRRNNVRLTCDGLTLTTAEWSRKTGIPARRIRSRLAAGWSVENALRR